MKYATFVMRPVAEDRSHDERVLLRYEDNYWTVRAVKSHRGWERTNYGFDPWTSRSTTKEERETLREISEEEFLAWLFEAGITL